MERIIEKLKNKTSKSWKDWSLKDKKELLEIYLIISEKEDHIFDLIYQNHDTDCWEDMFRDYIKREIEEKAEGVKVALYNIEEYEIKRNIENIEKIEEKNTDNK